MEEELNRGNNKALNQNGLPASRSAQYWAVFWQPLPEAGERIAVALVFQEADGPAWIRFDPRFSKTLRLYPDLDQAALSFYLESLRRELHSSGDVEATLNSYGPQLAVSAPRRIASPISRRDIEMLLARYVYPSKERPPALVAGAANCARERYLAPSVASCTGAAEQGGHAANWSQQREAGSLLAEAV